jgi:hypothetical protein
MQCHFTMCFDNYRICSSSGAWRQFGSGAFNPLNDQISSQVEANRNQWVQDYPPGSTTGAEIQPASTLGTDANNNVVDANNPGYYVDVNNGNYIDPATGNYINTGTDEPVSPTTGQVLNPDGTPKLDANGQPVVGTPQAAANFNNMRISMDGTHFIGSVCNTYYLTPGGTPYNTYYGPWGNFLWCEGSAPTRFRNETSAAAPHCGDEWNDNCLRVPDLCACVDDNLTSCGGLGGTSCSCPKTSGNTCPGTNTCATGFASVDSFDCDPCCIPSGLCRYNFFRGYY